jgi:uncharacterized protein (TIGR03067 family)
MLCGLQTRYFMAPTISGAVWMGPEDDGKTLRRFYRITPVPGTEPAQVDFAGEDAKEVLHGIYKVEADTLTICMSIDKKRTDASGRFSTRMAAPVMLIAYKRTTGEPEPSAPSNAADPPVVRTRIPGKRPVNALPDISYEQARQIVDHDRLTRLRDVYAPPIKTQSHVTEMSLEPPRVGNRNASHGRRSRPNWRRGSRRSSRG